MSSSTQKISLHHLAHVYYTHKNLDKAHQFLLDFGFSAIEERSTKDKIYYRGYGNEPFLYCAIKGDEDVFGGAAWAVDSIKVSHEDHRVLLFLSVKCDGSFIGCGISFMMKKSQCCRKYSQSHTIFAESLRRDC